MYIYIYIYTHTHTHTHTHMCPGGSQSTRRGPHPTSRGAPGRPAVYTISTSTSISN